MKESVKPTNDKSDMSNPLAPAKQNSEKQKSVVGSNVSKNSKQSTGLTAQGLKKLESESTPKKDSKGF